jgi:predicted nucleic acid-binding protein
MTFDDLAQGDHVFVDANVFVYGFTLHPQYGAPCKAFLDRIARKELVAYTSTQAVSEAAHRLMTLEAITQFNWPQAGIGNRLRQNPLQVQSLAQFRQFVNQVPQLGVQILAIEPALLDPGAAVCQQFGLLINDGLVIAVMQASSLTKLASTDTDFDRLPGITRHAPA